jgi:flavin reductase (DIM6/NTAB) family NADH-FMN oxidoreductase RutF
VVSRADGAVSARDIAPAEFRQLLGRFATGVAVVTTLGPGDIPVGMTASSLASVSLQPPLVSVCIDHAAAMHRAILAAPAFVINVLAESQEASSRRFAGEHPDRFDGIGYRIGERGLALLEDAHAWIECERHQLVEAGDHTIVIGRVVGGEGGSGRPLLYYRGGYGALG